MINRFYTIFIFWTLSFPLVYECKQKVVLLSIKNYSSRAFTAHTTVGGHFIA